MATTDSKTIAVTKAAAIALLRAEADAIEADGDPGSRYEVTRSFFLYTGETLINLRWEHSDELKERNRAAAEALRGGH